MKFVLVDLCRSRWAPLIFNRTRPFSFHPQTKFFSPRYPPITTHRMHHSFPSIDQCSWSNVQNVPCIFPPSPAPSNCSHGSPQIQLDPDDPTSTLFHQNLFRELEDLYAPPCADVSPIPGRGDVWDAFNLSQLYSANAGLPPLSARQTLPGEQQLVFGDAQSPFPFDMDNFCLTPTVYKNHNPVPTASFSVPDPPPPRFPPLPPPPTAQTSFLPNSQLDGPIFLTYPTPSGTVSTRDDSARQGDSPVTAPPPKRQPSQRAFGRSSKKRKTGKADINDKIVRAFLYLSHPDAEFSRAQRLCFNAA
jgi:hypothetical protein